MKITRLVDPMKKQTVYFPIVFHPSASLAIAGHHMVARVARLQKSGQVRGRRLFWVERSPDRNDHHVYRVIGEALE